MKLTKENIIDRLAVIMKRTMDDNVLADMAECGLGYEDGYADALHDLLDGFGLMFMRRQDDGNFKIYWSNEGE